MTESQRSSLSRVDRRTLLRTTGLTIGAGAVLAACSGSDSTGLARVGTVPERTTLEEAQVTDTVLLRTAMSLEYSAINTYKAAADAGFLSGNNAAIDAVGLFVAEHQAHAQALAGLITAAGGTPYNQSNERIDSVYVEPALALITESDDPQLDTLLFAHALETLATSTYHHYVSLLNNAPLRAEAIRIGADEAQHAAAIVHLLKPGLTNVAPSLDENGNPQPASVPSAFSSLSSVSVALGPTNEAGQKTTIIMDTPSLNSLAYE
jgi:rubrerythrin